MFSLYWGILAGIFLIIEVIVPTLISIWLAIAAFIVLFLSFVIKSLALQILIFSIISIILILTTRKFLSKVLKQGEDTINAQMINEIVVVTKVLSKGKYEVKYKGVTWDAISEEEYSVSDEVKIKNFKGNKIII